MTSRLFHTHEASPLARESSSAIPLSKRLRRETCLAHRLAEGTRLARAFFWGNLTAQAYAECLARLYPVYAVMETALTNAEQSDRVRTFLLPTVFRAHAILTDLRYFGVSPEPIRPGASARYCARIRRIADEKPERLVAHAYVRYMGDVSGGVIAGRVARHALKLPSRGGLAFLSFPLIGSPAQFRSDFRKRLDAFPQNDEESLEIVAEANVAFELNRALADELWEEVFAT